MKRVQLTLRGRVQGVGCRPFIYRLAHTHRLTGQVRNDVRGVLIEIQGPSAAVAAFVDELRDRSLDGYPALLDIVELASEKKPVKPGESAFMIASSDAAGDPVSQVTADAATCGDCLRELFEPADFRYHYPFINCTRCGPRYSIIKSIPYDRPNTTMADFAMCVKCQGQYRDVEDRRFHAQPVACPACGPQITLLDAAGRVLETETDRVLAVCAKLLRDGKIAAIKGIGGFHLAVDATDDAAVRRLRQRKHRDAKPFAMMAATLEEIRKHSVVGAEEERLLTSAASPIVLLDKKETNAIAPLVAFGTNRFGFMLPYAPLHHLLFSEPGIDVLVMTSANLADEPLICDNEQALEELDIVADVFLMHNRQIYRQLDDSVMHVVSGRPSFLRRARGYVPSPIYRARPAKREIFAAGPDLKNTFCFVKDDQFIVSEHIGDLADSRVYQHYVRSVAHLAELFQVRPQIVACDLHPGYLSTYFAAQMKDVRLVPIQHHWAHAASVLADAGKDGPIIALIADGTGYGTDGAIWGCECLIASLTEFERVGHLQYYPLAGGDKASKEAIRPLLGLLSPEDIDRSTGILTAIEPDANKLDLICTQIEKGLNTVQTSSLGRLFDAAAALIGVGASNRFEAELPIALESIAAKGVNEAHPVELVESEGALQWCFRPILMGLLDDLQKKTAAPVMAAKFHNSVASGLLELAKAARQRGGINEAALSGGVFCNRYLAERMIRLLQDEGFAVLWKKAVPVNDGGISLGQAAIAAALCEKSLRED
ncbi:MAG: carbamoyltransferase HypF [Planctomycetaceae bacterium]|nr:carbamoyltransferase HypF [Planctomycetaceae bacterium]